MRELRVQSSDKYSRIIETLACEQLKNLKSELLTLRDLKRPLFLPVPAGGHAHILAEGADEVLAAFVAHGGCNVRNRYGGVPKQLFGVFHPDGGEQLDEGLPRHLLDEAGGVFRGIVELSETYSPNALRTRAAAARASLA